MTVTVEPAVDALVRRIEWFNQLEEAERDDWAGVVAREALDYLAKICGPDLLRRAYGKSHDEVTDRGQSLELLSERLAIVWRFFAAVEQPGSGAALVDVATEAYLVSQGDAPKLFAQIGGRQGKRSASFELAMAEFKAIEWSHYFDAREVPRSVSHAHIAQAFGTTWDAIVKWKTRVAKELGQDVVDYRLAVVDRYVQGEQQTGGVSDGRQPRVGWPDL